jgi:cysteine desulfurase/selenocysteine lyase
MNMKKKSDACVLDAKKIKNDFPILKNNKYRKNLVYLDNAATSQKPVSVIRAISDYYENYNANVHRGIYKLSEVASVAYEDAHKKVAKFINAEGFDEIVFTRNTTESINLLAYSLLRDLKKGDEIVLSEMEHHSNLVPWQQLAKEHGLKMRFIRFDAGCLLDMKHAKSLITKKTKIVSCTHASNVLGTINPVKELAKLAHSVGALMVVDGAQSAPHMKIDVKDMDCDFFAFSGHKMLGPTGIGVLYGKRHLLSRMRPFLYGGGMISKVTLDDTTFQEPPERFEAGTPDISGAIGLAAAIDYLEKIGIENIRKHDEELTKYAIAELKKIQGVSIYGPSAVKDRSAVISFNIKGIHPHDVAEILDSHGVAVRAGNHCAMPLMHRLGISGSARASFYLYNDKSDVDALVSAIKKAKQVFKV